MLKDISRRQKWFRLPVYGLFLLALACGDDRPTDADLQGLRVYRHSMEGAPVSLDPVQAATAYSNIVIVNVFDTLYSYRYLARPYELKPNLAAELPEVSADGLTYTIKLRKGVRFIDDPAFPGGRGRELVAQDVVYSLQRHFDPANRPQGAWLWQGKIVGLEAWKERGSDYDELVEGLQALDSHTLRIKLFKPFPQLAYTLAQGYSAVVPREAVEHYGREFALRPIGSGPFKLSSWDTTGIVMVPNADFRWQAIDIHAEGYDPKTQAFAGLDAINGQLPPFVDRLEIAIIQDASARWNSFTKSNEIQYGGLPVELADSLLATKSPVSLKEEYAEKYQIMSEVEAGFVYASLNMDFPKLGYNPDPQQEEKNHALRCAMTKAFDWEARNESFYFGLGVIFPGIIPPAVPEFDPNLSRASVTRDVEGAKRLLREHGWNAENLPRFVYGASGGVRSRQFYEQFRAWMAEMGYPKEKLILKQYATFGDLNKQWRESRLPYIAAGWGLDYPDAENTLQLFYGPNRSPGSNNSNYNNPEYNALYEQASTMPASPERTKLYRRMNRIIIDDCVTIAGISRTRLPVWHRDVIMYPSSNIVGGFVLPYVALSDSAGGIRQAADSKVAR